jgi:putative ribosome biogenesis GTPase RsgA
MRDVSNTLPRLELPKRWELLTQKANNAGLDAKEFVMRVDSAASRVDKLLDRVRTGGGGLIEIFYGLSGSGKTTFLNTLPKFFHKFRVYSFPKER